MKKLFVFAAFVLFVALGKYASAAPSTSALRCELEQGPAGLGYACTEQADTSLSCAMDFGQIADALNEPRVPTQVRDLSTRDLIEAIDADEWGATQAADRQLLLLALAATGGSFDPYGVIGKQVALTFAGQPATLARLAELRQTLVSRAVSQGWGRVRPGEVQGTMRAGEVCQ